MPLVRHNIQRYGWVADTPDQRDHLYAAPVVQLKKLPPKVDLRRQCPKVIYDQGQRGVHAVLAVGYDDAQQRFVASNSWGKSWGIRDYFTMPYAYLTDSTLADDLCTIRIIAQ